MSRIGKKPIEIPQGVEVTIADGVITAKGPLGQESLAYRPEITVVKNDNIIEVTRANDERESRSFHGLTRTLINNLVVGVSTGFTKKSMVLVTGFKKLVTT